MITRALALAGIEPEPLPAVWYPDPEVSEVPVMYLTLQGVRFRRASLHEVGACVLAPWLGYWRLDTPPNYGNYATTGPMLPSYKWHSTGD